jgi:hypothetical protein
MKKNEPKWVSRILEVFLQSIEWTSIKSPVHQTFTYRCQNIDGTWEIVVSPWMHEIYGGRYDGALKLPSYEMNLLAVADEFDSINYIGFDTDRLEVTIEGKIDDSWVNFVFRKNAPQRSKFRKKLNVFTGEVTKITSEVQEVEE